MLNQKRHYTCKMTTVSSIMEQHRLQHVDLLKIDVERAELDVLMGIAQEDFLRIKQIVMEVHDINNRLKHIAGLLKITGKFDKIVVTQDQQLKGSTLFNMYCSRSKGGTKRLRMLLLYKMKHHDTHEYAANHPHETMLTNKSFDATQHRS